MFWRRLIAVVLVAALFGLTGATAGACTPTKNSDNVKADVVITGDIAIRETAPGINEGAAVHVNGKKNLTHATDVRQGAAKKATFGTIAHDPAHAYIYGYGEVTKAATGTDEDGLILAKVPKPVHVLKKNNLSSVTAPKRSYIDSKASPKKKGAEKIEPTKRTAPASAHIKHLRHAVKMHAIEDTKNNAGATTMRTHATPAIVVHFDADTAKKPGAGNIETDRTFLIDTGPADGKSTRTAAMAPCSYIRKNLNIVILLIDPAPKKNVEKNVEASRTADPCAYGVWV